MSVKLDRGQSAEAFQAACRERWPGANWTDEDLVQFQERSRALGGESQTEECLLAFAALHDDSRAVEAIENNCIQAIVPNLQALRLEPEQLEEVLQRLREHLFAPKTGQPRLAAFLGRGPLGAFVRSVAVRIALELTRTKRESGPLWGDLLREPGDDMERSAMKQQHRELFGEALGAAWKKLTPQQRLFLNHQLRDQLTIDELAGLYDIHRSTAARRVVSARTALEKATRQHLMLNLNLSPTSVESFFNLLTSQLTSIVSRELRDDPHPQNG